MWSRTTQPTVKPAAHELAGFVLKLFLPLTYDHYSAPLVCFPSKLWRCWLGHKKGITRAVLLQGEPRDATVNFDMYRILQLHRAASLPQHGFYCAMLRRAQLWDCTSSVCASIRLSVTIRYCDRIGWNSSKIISLPNSLRHMRFRSVPTNVITVPNCSVQYNNVNMYFNKYHTRNGFVKPLTVTNSA